MLQLNNRPRKHLTSVGVMQLRLNIDPSKKQLSFRFGPEQRSSKVNNFPPLDKTFLVFFSRKTRCLFAGWVSLWRRKVVQSTMPYSLSLAFHDHALQVRSSRRMTFDNWLQLLKVPGSWILNLISIARGLDCFDSICITTDAWTSGMFSWTVSTEPWSGQSLSGCQNTLRLTFLSSVNQVR